MAFDYSLCLQKVMVVVVGAAAAVVLQQLYLRMEVAALVVLQWF